MPGHRRSGRIDPGSWKRITEAPGPWTSELVEAHLREALVVRTPSTTIDNGLGLACRGSGIVGCTGLPAVVSGEDRQVIGKSAEALSWLRWLEPDDADLVMVRIEGASWKAICWRFDISRPTADRRWRYALALIAWRLDGHLDDRTPSMRSLLPEFGKARCETSSGGTRPVLIGDLRTGNWSR